MLRGVKITRLHLGHSYSSDRYSVCGQRPLAIAVMSVELSKSHECLLKRTMVERQGQKATVL